MAAFEYRQAEEIRDALAAHGARYLFIGKSGAVLLGFPDTTQDADIFVERSPQNGRALVAGLHDLGFELTPSQEQDIERGRDFVQLKDGPFDLDLIFPGSGTWRSKASRSATRTTSSPARKRRAARKTWSLCHDCAPSVTIGSRIISNTVATIEAEAAPSPRRHAFAQARRWSGILAKFVSVQIIVQAVGLVSGLLLIRTLTQREYAYFTLANTMQATLLLLADVGVSSALSATGGQVWHDKARFSELIATGLHVRKKLAWVGGGLALPILCWMLLRNGTGPVYAVLLTLAVLLGASYRLTGDVLTMVPRLHGRIDQLQKLDLTAGLVRLALIAAACLTFVNAAVGVAIASLSFGVQYVLLKRWTRETVDPQAPTNTEDEKTIFRMIKQQGPNSIYYCIQGQLTIVLISVFGNTQSVAEVGALGRLATLFTIIGTVMINVISPRFSRCQDREQIRSIYWQTIGAAVVLAAALLSVAVLLPKPMLWLLGSNYRHSTHAFGYVVLSSLIGMVVGTIFTLNSARGWMNGVWLATPFTFVAQLVMIPLVDLHTIPGVVLLNCIPTAVGILPCLYLGYRETCGRRDGIIQSAE